MKYTFKDIKYLINIIAIHESKDISLIQDYIGIWEETLNHLIDEFKENIKEIILEILGPYLYGFNRKQSKNEGLTDMIFDISLNEMPLYINSEKEWQIVISQWRLAINK